MRQSYPIVSANPIVQEHYIRCRQNGTSHSLAEMFATGEVPHSNSDVEFWKGRWEVEDTVARLYRKQAEAKGIDTAGKTYLGQLARYPGDPRAFVSDRHDVQKICETEGWGCRGLVSVAKDGRAQEEPEAAPGVADDLVESEVAAVVAREPAKARKKQQVRDEVRSKRTPHWNKGK